MTCRSCLGSAASSARNRCEHLDDDHAGAAARAWAGRHARNILGDIRLLLRVGGRRVGAEQCAGSRDVVGAVGVGEEPKVADAVEAPGQHVQEKAPDELVRVKPHRLPAARAGDAIVFSAERDAGVVGCNEAAVRDRDAMGVARQVGEHGFRPGERPLGEDHPCDRESSGEENEHEVLKPFIAIQRVQLPPGKGQPTSRKRALHGGRRRPS